MPTYEYQCTSCGHRMEVFQRLAEDPLTACERCGERLRKLFHAVGISFRGSGFYTTDSRPSNGSKKKPKDGKDSTKPKDGKDSTSAPAKKDSSEGSSSA